ncbi:MAG TPA: YdbH domain-containing protein, partial [Sphingomicrobium sp.]|nr:YdbH domain-containing protein [Sphingomicrobium sp.]
MVETTAERGERDDPDLVVIRRPLFRRTLTWIAVGVLLFLIVALVIAWTQRRQIARGLIDRELERRGVEFSYSLDRVGLRTQQISNLRIGNPQQPDVTARRVLIQMRLKWDGSVDVYRIVARGVRLRGRVLPDGRVSWGQIDRLLPPPTGEPFTLPDVSLDIVDTSIALRTPWGPLGFAIRGSGNLTGGFKGRFVSSSPKLVTGNCAATNVRGAAAIEIKARHPHVVGPLTATNFACPVSRFMVIEPRLEIDSRFGEAFDNFDASARIISQVLTAGDNGLAALNGRITLIGDPTDARGEVNLAAQRSRLGTIGAERTRVRGDYRMSTTKGTLVMVGEYVADDASLAPSITAPLTDALAATRATPIGPVAAAIGNAIDRSARSFDVSGGIRLVNFPGYGAARVTDATVRTATGGQARIFGGKGVTYYWPSGRLRFDGTIQMASGGLPTGTVTLHQAEDGGISGEGNFQPYTVNGTRLSLATLRFRAERGGATRFSTVANLTGRFPGGQIRNLNLPIDGRVGSSGGVLVGPECMVVSFDYLRMQQLQLGRTRLPVCPTGPAIIAQSPGGELRVGGRISNLALAGRLGSAPMRLNASSVLLNQGGFNGNSVALRLGQPAAPVILNAEALRGRFTDAGANGTLANADATIGDVKLRLTQIDGEWRFAGDRLAIDGDLMVNDRADPPRFYPLASNDVRFVLADNRIATTGSLRDPESGTHVTDVSVEHNLDSGGGHATLDVPGLRFGPNFQPEELTRLTEGVVALVVGTITGRGRIEWSGSGEVTSTGDFATQGMNLAAPFGPVEGLTTSIHFTDLLGLESAPGQVATARSINPGILVENGVIRYQLLPDQLVKIERGEWPFMGGRLILHETILNFGSDAPKRLTFELVGFDAKQFIDGLGFEGLEITGTFDGVLPMIFDESGGRIVGGRLQSRSPGGQFRYTGTRPDAGMMVGVAFDLLSDLRYRNMIVRLDGDLAGEFASRFTIQEVSLGGEGGFVSGIVRGAFSKVPLQVNLNVSGPFRALIQMAKGFKDPRPVIEPVMPFPLDAPGIVTEVRILGKREEQQRETPIDEIQTST